MKQETRIEFHRLLMEHRSAIKQWARIDVFGSASGRVGRLAAAKTMKKRERELIDFVQENVSDD